MSWDYTKNGKDWYPVSGSTSVSSATLKGTGELNFKYGTGNSTPSGNTVEPSDMKKSINVSGPLDGSKVDGSNKDDTIDLKDGSNTIHGKKGNDNITGSGSLYGDEGDDVLNGSGRLEGGKDDDKIYASTGCHAQNTISYTNGDGNDTIFTRSENDILSVSGTVVTPTGSSDVFIVGKGSIKDNYHRHFLHIDDSTGRNTYLYADGKMQRVIGNFNNDSVVIDEFGTGYLYNAGHNSSINSSNNGSKADWIYNSFMGYSSTINGGAGNDTLEDHSAAAVVQYFPSDGNDKVILDDYIQTNGAARFEDWIIDGRDNITHYYGAGLIAIEGTYNHGSSNKSKIVTSSGTMNVEAAGNTFTVRENLDTPDSLGSYKYTRYWEGKEWHSYVFRNDDRTTAQLEMINGGNTYDKGDASTKYQNLSNISLTNERDYFYTNFGVDKVIDALAGDDFMRNWGAVRSTLIGGDGDDTVYNDHKNYTKNVTIDGGIGDDYVYSNSDEVSIFGGTGKDTIYNGYSVNPTTVDSSKFGEVSNYSLGGASVTIDGGDDDDFIYSSGKQNTIFGGQGKDTVYNVNDSGPAVIDGGTEDDYIYNKSSKSTITGGNGKDTIINLSSIGSASIYGGDDTLNESNYIYNKSSQSTITAMGGNDTIYNMSTTGPAVIDAGDGNNFIYNNSSRSTITSGDGADRIYNNSFLGRAVINSGGGNDTVYNHSYHATITGGTGNDSIVDDTANSQINYSNGDGNDVITFAKTADVWGGDNLTYYYGGGLIAFTDGTTHTYGGYSNITTSVNIAPSKYTVEGADDLSVTKTSYSINGSFKLNVSGSNLTVNTNCFTVREGTDADNYEYKRYWANNWKDTNVKIFNSYIYLDDVHNDDKYPDYDGYEHGTYDNPYSNDKYLTETTISLSSNSDYFLTNFGAGKTIYALAGDDYISNYGASMSAFYAGDGDDTLYNRHGKASHTCLKGDGNTDYVTLDGSEGNDYIHNESKHVSITGGNGDDTVLNITIEGYSPDYTTIDSGVGDDSVKNFGSHVSIVGGTGKDSIYNHGDNATIRADNESDATIAGFDYNDYVFNSGKHASIFTGYGDDTIYSNFNGDQVSIDSGEGNDSIVNDSENGKSYINGGNGDNYIRNHASLSTIIAGTGKDTIYNESGTGPASIIAGDGDNYIENKSSESTITSGSGDDTIHNKHSLNTSPNNGTRIDAGDGNNYIENKSIKSTILSGTGNDTILNDSYTGPAKISVAGGDNTIVNNSSNSTIITGEGKDTIHNNSTLKGAYINSGDGDDLIYNNASAPTIISGNGNDTIYNCYTQDGKASVDAGIGDDRLFFDYADQVTINFGEGEDIVHITESNRNNKFVIDDYGDHSHNIVYGAGKVKKSDLLISTDKYATMAVGRDQRDLLVTLESGDFTYFVDVLDPTAPFDVMTAVVINDKTANTYNDNIKNAKDINLKNSKRNKLTVYNLDDMTTVVGSSVEKKNVDTLESFYDLFSNDDLVLDYGNNNVTVTNDPGLGFSIDNSIVAGIVTVVGSGYSSLGSSVVAKDSVGLTRDNALTVKAKKGKKYVTIANSHYDKVNYKVLGVARTDNIKENVSSIYRTKGITIRGNDASNFIVGGKGNDSIYGGGKGDDTIEGGAGKNTLIGGHDTVTSEIIERIIHIFPNEDISHFKEKVSNYANTFVVRAYEPNDPYIGKHVNENTIVDFEEQDKLKVANGFIELGEIKNNGTLRLIVKNNPYASGEPCNLNKVTVNILKGDGKKIQIINQDDTFSRQVYGAEAITVAADDGQTINTLWNPSVVTIDGSARITPVGLVGNAKNNLVLSGIGDNTLTTGSGKDTIVHYGGNDEITDYTEKKDIIKLQKDQKIDSLETVASASKNAIDVIYKLNNGGSIRVDKAITVTYKSGKAIYKKKNIKFVTDDGYVLQGSGSDVTLKLTKDDAAKNTKVNVLEISPAINIVDATSVSYKVGKTTSYYDMDLTGNGIIKCGNGNDTLTGGSGGDKLTGGKGKDVFVYGTGKDTITDYAADDRITLNANQELIDFEIKSKKHVVLSVGTGTVVAGSIQINNGKGKDITVNDETYSFGTKCATLKASTASNTLDISNKSFVKAVDASKSQNAVNIIGDNENNVLKGSKANDTLTGGMGDDTLTGGKGNDIFICNNGNDVITDYAAGDVISLSGSLGEEISWTVSKKDVIFNLGNGNTVKVKNGKGKEITINEYPNTYKKTESSSINLYVKSQQNNENDYSIEANSTQQIASSFMLEQTFDEPWFVTDDDFANDELHAILSTSPEVFVNYSPKQTSFNSGNIVSILVANNQSQGLTYSQRSK